MPIPTDKPVLLTTYHGTAVGAPLVGGGDIVSNRKLEALWVSNSYHLAAQFQDGEVRKLGVALQRPVVISEMTRETRWPDLSHASIVDEIRSKVEEGELDADGVIFLDTVDGMEVGDVIAVFGRDNGYGQLSVDHAVETLGIRRYDHDIEEWVSGPGFDEPGEQTQHNEEEFSP